MSRYALRTGEYLAISSDAIRRDADGFFLVMSDGPPDNETRGSVVLVNVRGALQQFCSPEGDSYEGIADRVCRAFAADPKPSAVVLRISSPGGVVAGLNETVLKLRRMSKDAGIPLIAYVDELAASAAYALCCACSEVLSPPSGVCGSIGVISTMVSMSRRDEQDGIEFRIITSGKRKADGHLHAPISDDAEKAERARNSELADQFFAIASKARGMSPKRLASLEAAIYLGKDAERVGLVDDVLSLDEALIGLDTSEVSSESAPAPNGGNITDRRAKKVDKSAHSGISVQHAAVAQPGTLDEGPMSVKLDALIKKTEAAIATAVDPKVVRSLKADLAAYAATRAAFDGDDEDDDKKDDDEDDDESKAKMAAKKAEEAKRKAEGAKHRARAAEFKKKAAEAEEEAKNAEESEEEEEASKGEEDDDAKAALQLVQSLTGMTGGEALGAIRALAATAAKTAHDVASLKAQNTATEKSRLIESIAKASTATEREFLGTQSIETVRGFVKMRVSSGFVNTSEDSLVRPKHVEAGSEESLPKETRSMIDAAVATFPGDKKAFRAELVKNHVAAHNSAIMPALNGAPGRI